MIELSGQLEEAWMPFPAYLAILLKRILEEKFIELREKPGGSVFMLGVKANPDALIITNKGRNFVNQIFKEKIGYETKSTY